MRYLSKQSSGLKQVFQDQSGATNSFVQQPPAKKSEPHMKEAIQIDDEFFDDEESFSVSSLHMQSFTIRQRPRPGQNQNHMMPLRGQASTLTNN